MECIARGVPIVGQLVRSPEYQHFPGFCYFVPMPGLWKALQLLQCSAKHVQGKSAALRRLNLGGSRRTVASGRPRTQLGLAAPLWISM